MQLARTTQLSKVARWVRKETQQNSREQFLKRFLMSPYFSQEAAYYPLVGQALSSYKAPEWHLIFDRTNLDKHRLDLLMVSLAFRKRAIPLGWEVRHRFKGANQASGTDFRAYPLWSAGDCPRGHRIWLCANDAVC
jgi:hypothetical protein